MSEEKGKFGLCTSERDVVSEGSRLSQQRADMPEARLNALRAEIQKGIDDLETGRFMDGPEAMAEIKEHLLKLKDQKAKFIITELEGKIDGSDLLSNE